MEINLKTTNPYTVVTTIQTHCPYNTFLKLVCDDSSGFTRLHKKYSISKPIDKLTFWLRIYDYYIIHYTNCEQIKEKLTTLHRTFFHHEFRKSFSVTMYIKNKIVELTLQSKLYQLFTGFRFHRPNLN